MLPAQKTWQISSKIPSEIDQKLINFPPFFRQILFNRGIQSQQEALEYLSAAEPAGSKPGNIPGLEEAVDLILWHTHRRNKIVIYGDYDVDGVTACSLLTDLLSRLGTDVQSYIPNRFDEGYGLNVEAIDTLSASGAKLVITVDCGIRSLDEAKRALETGLDLIVTDHHQPGMSLPEARVIVNPKLPLSQYPDKNLAGVGIAYKIASGIVENLVEERDRILPDSYLDLVAVGTVADLAPLVMENRSLVRKGIHSLQTTTRQGLRSLMGVAGISPEEVTSTHIGFMIGPRLNAAGRLDSAMDALALLSTRDVQEAGRLAQKLNLQNQERQELTRLVVESASQKALDRNPESRILIAADPNYNPGVVGLAAARLTENYYLPSIVAHHSGEYIQGSCRSIPEFHITQALDECDDILEKYGGHAAAAGFTLLTQRFDDFCGRMEQIASRDLGSLDLKPVLPADLEIELFDLKPYVLDYLNMIEPVGMGNRQAQFVSRQVKVVRSRAVGRNQSHLKLTLTDGKVYFDAIAFRFGYLTGKLAPVIDILYTFELNKYNGRTSLQLNIQDIHT